jgi:hypothetical protein
LVCDVRVALAAAFLCGLPAKDDVSPQQAVEDAQGAAASRTDAQCGVSSILMHGRCWWTVALHLDPIGTSQMINGASYGQLWSLSLGRQRWPGLMESAEV